jgi:hypothetical protein
MKIPQKSAAPKTTTALASIEPSLCSIPKKKIFFKYQKVLCEVDVAFIFFNLINPVSNSMPKVNHAL